MLASVAGAAMACSTTATISHHDGQHQGRIVRATESLLYFSEGGRTRPIRRYDVIDIDHPGNVHAVVGGALLATGVSGLAFFDVCAAPWIGCTASLLAIPVGLLTASWGVIMWPLSRRAARPSNDETVARMAPSLSFDGHGRGTLGLTLRY